MCAYVKKQYYRRRYYNKKYPLKKSNIFSKKSAKSQAKQIYALNKKINNIEKRTKPETITQKNVFCNRLFTVDGLYGSYGVKEWHTRLYLYEDILLNADQCNYQIKGHMLRPYNITISGLFENKNHNVELNGKILTPPLTGYLRFIVCKLVGGNQSRYPERITQSYSPNTDDIGLIMGPLINNVSASLKVIKNKVIKIDNVKDSRLFKIKIKNPGTYRIGVVNETAAVLPAFKNEYLVYVQYFCPDQMFLDGYEGQQPVAPIQRLTSGIKFAFVDES